jgi:hypothetical protein
MARDQQCPNRQGTPRIGRPVSASNTNDSTMPGAVAPRRLYRPLVTSFGGFVDRPGRREAAGMAFALKRRALRALIITSLAKPSVSGRCSMRQRTDV